MRLNIIKKCKEVVGRFLSIIIRFGNICFAGMLKVWQAIGNFVSIVIDTLATFIKHQKAPHARRVAKGSSGGFAKKSVLFNTRFYLVYTILSLLVLLLIGSLMYWKFGTRYPMLPQHVLVHRIDASQQATIIQQQEHIDKLNDIQQRLEARITATEQRLKVLESKTVQVDQKLNAVDKKTDKVAGRVENLERVDVQEARRFAIIDRRIKKEVDEQFDVLRKDAQENQKQLKRKKMLERFLDQLAESEN